MALNGIPISEDQCIGDSLSVINEAFQALDSRVSVLNSTVVTLSSNTDVTYTDLTGNGLNTFFTIGGYSSSRPERYMVHVEGLYQRPGIDYTTAPNTIIFSVPPPNQSVVSILALF